MTEVTIITAHDSEDTFHYWTDKPEVVMAWAESSDEAPTEELLEHLVELHLRLGASFDAQEARRELTLTEEIDQLTQSNLRDQERSRSGLISRLLGLAGKLEPEVSPTEMRTRVAERVMHSEEKLRRITCSRYLPYIGSSTTELVDFAGRGDIIVVDTIEVDVV